MADTFSRHPTLNSVSYLPPDWPTYASNDGQFGYGQQFAMWYPKGPRPKDGYPCLVVYNFANFGSSSGQFSDDSSLTIGLGRGLQWQALNWGIALAQVQVSAPNKNVIGGRGFWHPPGASTNNDRRFEDSQYQSCFKDAVLAFQHIRYEADKYDINPNMMGVHGGSAGAHIAAYVAMSPNLANSFGVGGQHEVSTVPNVAALNLVAIANWNHYVGSTAAVPPTLFSRGLVGEETAAANLDAVSDDYKATAEWVNWTGGDTDEYVPPISTWTQTPSASEQIFSPSEWETAVADNTQLHNAFHFAYMKSAFPRKVLFGLKFSAITTATNSVLDFILDAPLSQAGAPYVKDPLIQHLGAHIGDRAWDADIPAGGIRRASDVESVGRYIMPAHPKRKRVEVTATSGNILVGSNASTAKQLITEGSTATLTTSSRVYAKKDSAGNASFIAVEHGT